MLLKAFSLSLPRRIQTLPPETCWGRPYKFLKKNAWEGGGGVKWYLLKEKKSRGGALFDRSTKPNIQCTVSVYHKCHFQSTLWTTAPVKVFISAYSANSGNYANNTYILSRNQQSVQFKVQHSHLFIVLQLQLELPASPQSPLPPTFSCTVRSLSSIKCVDEPKGQHHCDEGIQHREPTPVLSLSTPPSAPNVAVKV